MLRNVEVEIIDGATFRSLSSEATSPYMVFKKELVK